MNFTKVSKIISYRKGKATNTDLLSNKQELPYLSPEYLRGNDLAETVCVNFSSVIVENGDLILLWDGSNAGEFFKAKKGILSSTMVVLEHSTDFEKDFLYYALKNEEVFLKGQTSGSGIPHVDKEILGNIRIGLFLKKEQTSIAEVLTTTDEAIEQTKKLVAKHEGIKRGLMQDLLTRGIDEHGNIRSEETHEFKDTILGKIPVEWEEKTVGDVLRNIDAGKSPLCLSRPTGAGEWGVLKVSAIRSEGFNPIENKTVKSTSQINEPYEVRNGDLLISRANTPELVGEVCLVHNAPRYLMLSDKTLRLKVNRKKVLTEFLFQILQTPFSRYQIEMNATGSSGSMKNISQKTIENLIIPLPQIREQEKIIKILECQSLSLRSALNNRDKLIRIKHGLMQDLLSGNVPVTHLIENN